MKVGYLEKYDSGPRALATDCDDLGTIIETGLDGQYYVMWHTCDNEGWWNGQNLRVVSENR